MSFPFQGLTSIQTYAVLKQPPSAPARAASKGVSSRTGFDCIGMILSPEIGGTYIEHGSQSVRCSRRPDSEIRPGP